MPSDTEKFLLILLVIGQTKSQFNTAELTAAGYYLNEYGNWQRGFVPVNTIEDTLGVEAYAGGTITKNLNTIQDGLGMHLVHRPNSVSRTIDPLALARNVPQIHRQELGIHIEEIHQQQQVVDQQLRDAQNRRVQADVALTNTKNSPPMEKAQAKLNLQNAIVDEIQARIKTLEKAVEYIDGDIILNNGRIWWPKDQADAQQAGEYVRARESDKASVNQLLNENRNNLAVAKSNIDNTKNDMNKIRNGNIPEKYKTEAEIKAKVEAEARARAQAEAKRRTTELMAKARVQPAPTYTPAMIQSANMALSSPGTLALNRQPGTPQLAVAGVGALATPEGVLSTIGRGFTELSRVATVSGVGATVGALVMGFWPKEAGKGSDKVPGRDVSALFSYPVNAVLGKDQQIQPGTTSVNLPVRGSLVMKQDGHSFTGHLALKLLKTGTGGVAQAVPVLQGVRDPATGLDKITIPAVAGKPSKTILINPTPLAPTAPSHTGNANPVPTTPTHTGTAVKPVENIITTTSPGSDASGLQDFIYWQPDASGSGVEPVYVMLGSPYGPTNAKGKYSGRDYHTDKAGGPIQNLNWKTTNIDRAGVDNVKLHTSRFGQSADNSVMIDRLEKILKGELAITDTDKRFYTHELRELERYRALNVPDGVSPDDGGAIWNSAHTATLEDYKLGSEWSLLYTPEALNAE